METTRLTKTVVVLGASPKIGSLRLSRLGDARSFEHRPIPVNPAFEKVLDEPCFPTISAVPKPIDTVTLYLGRRARRR